LIGFAFCISLFVSFVAIIVIQSFPVSLVSMIHGGEEVKERLDPIQQFEFPPLLCTFPRNLLAQPAAVYLQVSPSFCDRPRKARVSLPRVASDRRKIIIGSCECKYWLDQLPEHGSSIRLELLTFPRIRQSRLLRPKSTRFLLSSSSRPQIRRGSKPPCNRVDSQ